MTSELEQAWRAIYRAYMSLAPAIDHQLKSSVNLTYSEYEALSQLNGAGQPMTMADLASRVAVTRTHVSRLVDSLEAADLAKRNPNPDDGRSTLVTTTRNGSDLLAKAALVVQSVIADQLGSDASGHELRQALEWAGRKSRRKA